MECALGRLALTAALYVYPYRRSRAGRQRSALSVGGEERVTNAGSLCFE